MLRTVYITIRFITIALLFCIMGSSLWGQEKLQYNLNKGDVFNIRQDAQQTIVQEIDGAAHEITNDISGLLEFKVIETSPDAYTMEVTFRDLNLKMTSNIQGELVNVNAKEIDENNVQSRIFNSLLNVPIHIVLASNGDVLEVKGGDSLVTKMTKASGVTDEFSLNIMKASLNKEFGSEALSNSYEQMTYIYPNDKIRVGDTWENTFAGELNARNTWKLEALNHSNAIISGTAIIVMDIKEPATTMQLDGTQNTQITTDFKSGFIVKMKVDGFSKGFATIAQMGEQQIPTTISSTITYELIN